MSQSVVVVSHRRSGTHLTIDAIINNFQIYRNNPPIPKVTLDHLSSHVAQKTTQLTELSKTLREQPCVIKSHTHANLSDFFMGDPNSRNFVEELFDSSKVIYVYRDGRDVLVSLYYYNQLFDETIKNMSFSQYVRMQNTFDSQTYLGQMNRPTYWKFHVLSWFSRPNVLYLSFQDILTRYEGTIHKIAEFIDQPVMEIKDVRRTKPPERTRLRKLLAKFVAPLQPRYSSVGFRKGKSGDWQRHFSTDDLAFFEEQAGEINNDLLNARLGAS